jgi:hypothetical protein
VTIVVQKIEDWWLDLNSVTALATRSSSKPAHESSDFDWFFNLNRGWRRRRKSFSAKRKPLAPIHGGEPFVIQVGVTGFEPAAFWSQTRRSSQTELHPAFVSCHWSLVSCQLPVEANGQ